MKQAPLLRGVVIAIALGLSLAADSDTAVSDPSKLFKPSPKVELDASSSMQRTKSSLPTSNVTAEDGPEAKTAQSGDSLDPYQLFPPSFHQFLDIPMHTMPNGTSYEPKPTYSDDASHGSHGSQGSGNPPPSAAHEAPDYNYYDTGGPTGTAGADSGSQNNHQPSNSDYRETPTYSTNPSKDQSYANYVASLTNNNKFGQQPAQGYESQYEDDYENDYEGNYGSKVKHDDKKPSKGSKPQYSPSSHSSATGPQDSPQVDSPTKSKSSSNKYSPSSKNKLQSTSQQSYSGANNYYSDSGSSRKPFKPSQAVKTASYDDEDSNKASVPLYAQATPSQGSKSHYQPSFSSTPSKSNSGKNKKPSKPYAAPSSSPSDDSGPASGASAPSADEEEESGRDSYKSRPSSRPSKPSYSRPADESSDYEHSDYEQGPAAKDQGPAAKSPKTASYGKGSRPFSSPIGGNFGGSDFGSPFGQQSPAAPNQPISTKFADGWKPISKPSSASTSSESNFKDFDDGGYTNPRQPSSGYSPKQPSFAQESGRPGSSGYDNAPNGEEESEGNDAEAENPAYDYYGNDDGPSPTDSGSRPSDQPEQPDHAESEGSASGPAKSGPPPPPHSFNEGPSRPNKRPAVNDGPGKPPKFGPPKFADNDNDNDKDKDTSAPVADDFEFDEYSSEPVNKKPVGGRPGFGPGPPARRPNKQGGRPFNDGPAPGRPFNDGPAPGRPFNDGPAPGRPFNDGSAPGRPGPNFNGNNRPNQGKFNSPPGRRPGFGQGGPGGRPQRPLDDGRAPQKNNGGVSNEISDDVFDFDDTPPPRPNAGRRPGGPGPGGNRQRQQQKRPLVDDSQLYDDSEEFENPGPPRRRPQGGRGPGGRPNNRPVFNDDDEESFFQDNDDRRRPGPNRRPNPFRQGPGGAAGRKRPEPGEPAGGEGDSNSDAEAEALQIPDDFYEDAALEAMADVLLDDLDLEDNENGAPPPTANGGPPPTAPSEFLQPGGYPPEEDESSGSDDGPPPQRPAPFGRGPPRGRPFNAPPPRGREEGFGPVFAAAGRNQQPNNARPNFLRQMFGGRRPFRRGGGEGGGEQAVRRRGQKRNRPGPDGDDIPPPMRRRPMNDQPRRRPPMNRQRNPEAANKRHGGGFAQKLFAGLRVPRPQLIPQLNVGPLGFILSKRSSTQPAEATRQKRSLPPWVTHHALAPPRSVQNFIQQFYSERSNVATLTDGPNRPKSSGKRA